MKKFPATFKTLGLVLLKTSPPPLFTICEQAFLQMLPSGSKKQIRAIKLLFCKTFMHEKGNCSVLLALAILRMQFLWIFVHYIYSFSSPSLFFCFHCTKTQCSEHVGRVTMTGSHAVLAGQQTKMKINRQPKTLWIIRFHHTKIVIQENANEKSCSIEINVSQNGEGG